MFESQNTSKSTPDSDMKRSTASLIDYIRTEVKDVRVLSDQYLCVVWDSTDAVQAKRIAQFGALQEYTDATYWKRIMLLKFQTMAVWKQTRPAMLNQLVSNDQWLLNGRHPESCSIWTQSVDAFPDPSPQASPLPLPRLVEYVYIKLPAGMRSDNLTIVAPNGQKYVLAAGGPSYRCWSIKVNQVGYRPDTAKCAYYGMWLGEAGAMPVDHLLGKPFEVLSTTNNRKVYQGTIKLRARNSAANRDNQPLTGEDVCELDFSELKTSGEYVVYIRGIGSSWPFRIDKYVYAQPFYTTMRGLYHQRCGTALERKCTQWARPACHQQTYQAAFIPEGNKYYNNPNGVEADGKVYGFSDEQNKPISINPFTMVFSTKTDRLIPGLNGGWHDAADFDRRFWHYEAVWDLCGAFEMYPSKFTDGQLQIPESGNGIPDILDEAMVGIDIWAKTQNAQGGVAGWIEQTSHPAPTGTADKDKEWFYCGVPDRASSWAFAAAAAQMSRLLKPYDRNKAAAYLKAAQKAHDWARNDANRISNFQFTVKDGARQSNLAGRRITLRETPKPIDMGEVYRPMAALQLYAATRESVYLQQFREYGGVSAMLEGLPDAIPHFAFVTPLCSDLLTPAETQQLLSGVLAEADVFEHGSESLPYRNVWRPIDHKYFNNMGWGMGHPAYRARLQILAYRVTGEQKYFDAAINGANWQLGANELGRSLETGVGSVFPVVIQHIDSQCDGIDEPVPGISPFTLTYGMAASSWWYQYSLMEKAHPDSTDFYDDTPMVVLPQLSRSTDVNKKLRDLPRKGEWMWDAVAIVRPHIERMYPIMRRVFIHPNLEPSQNEFTTWECIAPHAALYGCLLPDGWKPQANMSARVPRKMQQMVYYPQP